MKCPFCAEIKNKVIDSRLSKDGRTIRRRRECLNCEKRFTTYEKVEAVLPMVVKKDGRREPFNHEKMSAGIQRACQKRPISINDIDDFVDSLGQLFQEIGHRETRSSDIGERVIEKLKELNLTPSSRILKKLVPAYDSTHKDELYSKIGTGLIRLDDLKDILACAH